MGYSYLGIGQFCRFHPELLLTASELVQGEQSVDHGTIITVGCRCQHNEEEQQIGIPQTRNLPPDNLWEFLSGDLEVTWSFSKVCHVYC